MNPVIVNLHYNKAQIKAIVVGAKRTFLLWGRGTGKSQGVIAYKSANNMHKMPRCSGVFVGHSFRKILTDLLPNIIFGWERLGYLRDKHFVIGRKPPNNWKWPRPYISPEINDYFIHWYTGAGIHINSQDRKVTSNGLNVDFIHGDEAKQLNYQRLKTELFPTNRGNLMYFGHLPEHHELLFCSDKQLGKGDTDWWKAFKEEYDPKLVELIINLKLKIEKLELEGINKKNEFRYNRWKQDLVMLQKNCTFYSEASSFENIDALGPDFFKDQYRNLTKLEFRSAILNEDISKVEGGFYAAIDEHIHGYTSPNYSFIDSLDYNFDRLSDHDSRMDSDIITGQSLDISIDWGGKFNALVVTQSSVNSILLLKNFYCTPPKKYIDLVRDFIHYYRFHKCKHVNLYYDVAGNRIKDNSNFTSAEDVIKELVANGWTVTNKMESNVYIPHTQKHRIWSYILDESNNRNTLYPVFRFNKDNAFETYVSMARARLKLVGNDMRKDKSDESKDIPQQDATHLSDAIDYIVCTRYRSIGTNSYTSIL